MLVSYVAGEGVELTVRKESVVVEEIKEVKLRCGHAPSRLPVKKLRRLLHKRRKAVRVFVWKGIWKNIISYYSAEVHAPIASFFVEQVISRSDLEISRTNTALTSSNSLLKLKTYGLCVPNFVPKKHFWDVFLSAANPLLRAPPK